MILRPIFTFILALILATPSVQAESKMAASPLFSVELLEFIKTYSLSRFQYQLTEEELLEIFEKGGATDVRLTVAANSVIKQGKMELPDQFKMQLIEDKRKMKDDALKIANRILKASSVDELNLQMLVMAQYFLYRPESRGPIREIVLALQNTINEDYFRDLEKKKTVGYQVAAGGTVAAFTAGLASLLVPSQSLKGLLTHSQEKIFASASRALKRQKTATHTGVSTHTGTSAGGNAAEEAMTRTEALEALRQLGAFIPRVAVVEKETPTTLLIKSRIMNRLKAATSRENVRNIFILTGVSYGVGGIYAGGMQLKQALHKPELDDNYLDPQTVFMRDYNGLAVLDLQCRIEKLKAEFEQNPGWDDRRLRTLNQIVGDYEILVEFAPEYAQKRKLTVPTAYNAEKKSYQTVIIYNGHRIDELIPCHDIHFSDSHLAAGTNANVDAGAGASTSYSEVKSGTEPEVGLESILSDLLEITTE